MFSAGKVGGIENREQDPGKTWCIVSPGMAIKPYPCCRSTHSSIDASLYLRNTEGVDASQVVKTICKTSPQHTKLARFHKPKTAYEGKFSIPWSLWRDDLNSHRSGGDTRGVSRRGNQPVPCWPKPKAPRYELTTPPCARQFLKLTEIGQQLGISTFAVSKILQR